MTLNVDRCLEGKRILLTGVTGFLGKVVLERLLSEVSGIGSIVVLLRPSERFADAHDRFEQEVLASSIFDSAKRDGRFETSITKVSCIAGELTEPRLGLAPQAFRELGDSLDLVINAAASVNFREPLDRALRVNAYSLRALGELVRQGDRCRFLQVSTCYVHGRRSGLVAERNNPPVGEHDIRDGENACTGVDALLRHLDDCVEGVRTRIPDEDEREQAMIDCGVEQAQRHGWNDTYTMTKWLGEQLLFEAFGDSGRLSIVRPAIVESTLRSPVAGWIEGVKVADALILAYAHGKVAFFPGRRDGVLDIIPADLVANTIVLAAAELLQLDTGRRIYQSASSVRNPVSLGRLVGLLNAAGREDHARLGRLFRRRPTRDFVLVPKAPFGMMMSVSGLFARAGRALGIGTGANRRKAETTRKLARLFAFYTTPDYRFDVSETLALANRFDPQDRTRFAVDAADVDWEHYVRRVHLPGLNRHGLGLRKPRGRDPERASTGYGKDDRPTSDGQVGPSVARELLGSEPRGRRGVRYESRA